jgi:hypothetical protein
MTNIEQLDAVGSLVDDVLKRAEAIDLFVDRADDVPPGTADASQRLAYAVFDLVAILLAWREELEARPSVAQAE